jgi:hypothetical protein
MRAYELGLFNINPFECIGFDAIVKKIGNPVFREESDSTPSLNIHTFLRSGIEVKGVELWIERFIKIKRILLE